MGLSGLLLILVPFILLEGVQQPGLVEGSAYGKYWGLSLSSAEMELAWEEGAKSSTSEEECFLHLSLASWVGEGERLGVPPAAPFLLGRRPR